MDFGLGRHRAATGERAPHALSANRPIDAAARAVRATRRWGSKGMGG
jgi:hypothetical protein